MYNFDAGYHFIVPLIGLGLGLRHGLHFFVLNVNYISIIIIVREFFLSGSVLELKKKFKSLIQRL